MIRRSSSLPRYLTQNQIHSLFGAILSLRDRALFVLVYGCSPLRLSASSATSPPRTGFRAYGRSTARRSFQVS